MTETDGKARTSLRVRIMGPMILMAALTLAASGAIVAAIQQREIVGGTDAQLIRVRDELRVLAEDGIDPGTGQPFAGPSELLRTYLARTVVSEAEGSSRSWVRRCDGWRRPMWC
ncbi:hypothetical protein [Tessaracoccus coleopterorum]|uniref:hypothetical protein n=1 Tax=Tessaracoccus coleopterorum TaxID=2714950 RepID=UPI0018D423F7|nr:hypothetical protein [Tessaracoccus coleopterorum]